MTMRRIVYYVASSIDGYISGPDDDVSGFIPNGSGVDKYLEDLKSFDTVIMGRKTYEFGYRFGMEKGKAAYPHMQNYIISNSLSFDKQDNNLIICKPDLEFIRDLQREEGSDIYLCGGGQLAGWLLDNSLIDILKIKLNPVIIGVGVNLFGNSNEQIMLSLEASERYDKGLIINTYNIKYHGY